MSTSTGVQTGVALQDRQAADPRSPAEEAGTEPGAAAVIEARDLTRRFGKEIAVDGLDLRIRQGEIFGLIGPDGAGKTTTLRLLATVMNPTSGWVRVFGQDAIKRSGSIKRRIGYMAQRFSLYGDLSVSENLSFFADLYGVTGLARRERIDRLLRFAHLTEFRERRAAHLSGGMQKKLALACTLVHTPELILLDEPTTGVDPVSRREFWDILSELHIQGVTLVISTPYMDEAERCSRVGLMSSGRMVACDSPRRLKDRFEGEVISLRPTDIRGAVKLLVDLPGVQDVQAYGSGLRIMTTGDVGTAGRVCEALTAAGIGIDETRTVPIRMEEMFVSLAGSQPVEGS